MIAALKRKFGHVARDPVLRHYLLKKALGRVSPPPPFVPGHPPYLPALALHGTARAPVPPQVDRGPPRSPLTLHLPGETITVSPGEETVLFQRRFADLETFLALHRFSWLPLLGHTVDPCWVGSLWQAWCAAFGTVVDHWAWHPYTAAERAINILDHARHFGLPGSAERTWSILSRHPQAIMDRLEYGGDHYTGNHLSNNGRGLFLLGLALDWPQCRDFGAEILRHEASRIFLRSGILREESTHYHLLLTRNYLSCWLAAQRHGLTGMDWLKQAAVRAWAVCPYLSLPGGLPLIGDISPDCPPDHLSALCGGAPTGWLAYLDAQDFATLTALAQDRPQIDPNQLCEAGWLRFEFEEWSGVWHASPSVWPFMPGHGHQDLGGFELHWRGSPVFIDPGRGAYGDDGDAAHYRSAAVHNLIRLNGADPAPTNRPYYDDAFRAAQGGRFACLLSSENTVSLEHDGFRRQGISAATRLWRFDAKGFSLTDRLQGRGQVAVDRQFVTPWPVHQSDHGVTIDGPSGKLFLSGNNFRVRPVTRWTAYGVGTVAWLITASDVVSLGWEDTIRIEVL